MHNIRGLKVRSHLQTRLECVCIDHKIRGLSIARYKHILRGM